MLRLNFIQNTKPMLYAHEWTELVSQGDLNGRLEMVSGLEKELEFDILETCDRLEPINPSKQKWDFLSVKWHNERFYRNIWVQRKTGKCRNEGWPLIRWQIKLPHLHLNKNKLCTEVSRKHHHVSSFVQCLQMFPWQCNPFYLIKLNGLVSCSNLGHKDLEEDAKRP